MRAHQTGFTMVELMIALAIGLFLMSGLMTLVQDNRRTFDSQSKLAVLQDSQRLAFTMMTDVAQEAGYFPDPTTNTAASTLPAVTAAATGSANAMASGQAITGTDNAAAPGDTITIRYTTATGDGILNCNGTTNSSGANAAYANTFKVVVTGGISQLVCLRESGVVYPLVNGVQNLQLLYGVNTLASSTGADTYMTSTQVTAANAWGSVISVQISLTFVNPLYVAAGLGQQQYLTLSRMVSVMNQTG
jgi:type IV pilus assembly protein PilW